MASEAFFMPPNRYRLYCIIIFVHHFHSLSIFSAFFDDFLGIPLGFPRSGGVAQLQWGRAGPKPLVVGGDV